VRLRVFELLFRVEVGPRVPRMFGERSVGPVFSALEVVVIRIVGDKVDGQLAPDQQLI